MSEERYEIRGKIGQGGVGAVYQAFDTQLNREVAIKRVLAEGGYEDQGEATKHLLKEATALSSVQHPHIVTVYDAGIDADGPYVVMELIHGRTLDEMVERGTLTWNDLREVALQTQEALIAAQDLNLVHRDLKPSNVMVCWLPSGKFQVKIVDFGLAKFSATPSLQTIDHGDAVFGSIFFMAPEQFERTPLDKRTDMYAMGCLYYYALTGEYPFTGDTAAEVMASHLQHHVKPIGELRPDVPQWGCDWIMWHIERRMDDRPKDARESLERFLILDKQSTQPITMTAPDPKTPDPTPAKPKFIFPGADGSTGDAQPPVTPATPATPAPPVTPVAQPAPPVQPAQPVVAPVQPTAPTTPQPISLQAAQPAPAPAKPATAPQPISPPDADLSPHTKSQNITESAQPATPAQPAVAQPAITPQPAVPVTPVQLTPAQPTPTVVQPTPTPVQPSVSAAAPVQPAAPATTPPASLTGSAPQPVVASPTVAENQPPANVVPVTASAKKGMPTGAKYAIIGMLALVIAVAIIVGVALSGERRETALINEVMVRAKALDDEGKLHEGIELTEEELKGTLNRATSMADNRQRPILLKTLAYATAKGGYDANTVIIDHVTKAKCPQSIRSEIFKTVMSRRKDVANIAPLLEFAKNTTEETAAAEAINAARYSAIGKEADVYIDDFLSLINDTDSHSIRGAAERAAQAIIAESDKKADFEPAIYGSYQSAVNDNAKFTMLRLLGCTGGEKAQEAVSEALKSDKAPYQSAAIAALSIWADDGQFDNLIEFIDECENDKIRKTAFDAAYSFLRIERQRDSEDLGELWKSLAGTAKTQGEKLQIIRGMANQKHEWAIPVLEYFTEDKDDMVIDKAERAKELVERRIREKEGSSDE
ncbi:MAG: protein kinase [Akkermansiaceae bacterium]|nr:protein kinase [Akkermansiaceae bacterium]